jgi:hypothetical protein
MVTKNIRFNHLRLLSLITVIITFSTNMHAQYGYDELNQDLKRAEEQYNNMMRLMNSDKSYSTTIIQEGFYSEDGRNVAFVANISKYTNNGLANVNIENFSKTQKKRLFVYKFNGTDYLKVGIPFTTDWELNKGDIITISINGGKTYTYVVGGDISLKDWEAFKNHKLAEWSYRGTNHNNYNSPSIYSAPTVPSQANTYSQPAKSLCYRCNGKMSCLVCSGTGTIYNPYGTGDKRTCSTCSGTGKCPRCGGTGFEK